VLHRLVSVVFCCLLAGSLACAALPAAAQGRGHGAGGLGGGLGGAGGGLGGVPVLRPAWPEDPRRAEPVTSTNNNANNNTTTTGSRGAVVDLTQATPPGLQQKLEHAADPALDALTGPRGNGRANTLADAASSRRALIDELVMTHPEALTLDARGNAVVRGELVLEAPDEALLRAAAGAGFSLLREQHAEELGLHLVVLATPPGLTPEEAEQRLAALDPGWRGGANPLYLPSGNSGNGGRPPAASAGRAAPGSATRGRAERVGLVDGGLDPQHPALRGRAIERHGCERVLPTAHGTAVASLLVGEDGAFHGALQAQRLYAADVYCGRATGGALDAVVAALAWLARERVPVLNLSLVGPPHPVLERAVAALVARGHLLVAAVGNDGPAAPPLYPAAYPGVVGVTAVDAQRRVLPEAGRGAQVMLAAPGADLAVALPGGGYGSARGTSFAAPLVAGLLAARLPAPEPAAARAALDALAAQALDLGGRGRNPVFGRGLVGEGLVPAAAAVAAR
jgi:hypothetical protein